jgi:very-short-patch-repair endonuclease
VIPPDNDVESGICSECSPADLVAELAYRKALAVRNQLSTDSPPLPFSPSPTLILAADTVAECDGFILGKPRDERDARAMLTQLSNRDHRVLTGVCLLPLPPGEGRGEGALSPAKKLLPLDLLNFAREIRKSQSDAESKMWQLLRDRRISDCKFRRQHPVDPYVLDFYCHEKRLAIELDGGQHNSDIARSHDQSRTRYLEKQRIRVIRFWNHEVVKDTEAVLEAIWEALHDDQGTLTPNPSSKGRGEPLIRVAVTKLRMDKLTTTQLNEYLANGQWEGKAGAFGYQDRLGWVHIVEGSESNVVGLPMELLAEMLAEFTTASTGQV